MMEARWKSFVALVTFAFTSSFIWSASLIYRYGILPPNVLIISMEADLETIGIWAFLLDFIIFTLLLKIVFPHRWIFHQEEKGDMRGS